MSQDTLRITIQENDEAVLIKLEGRVVGPWATELNRAWQETAPSVASRKLSLDLCGVTYADDMGRQVLSEIHARSGAEIVFSTQWARHLAEEITQKNHFKQQQEPGHAEQE